MIIIKVFNGTGSAYGSHMTRETFYLGPRGSLELLERLMSIPPRPSVDPHDDERKVVIDLIHALNMACCDEIERRENDDE